MKRKVNPNRPNKKVLARPMRRIKKLEGGLIAQRDMLKKVYQYFDGSFKGIGEILGGVMRVQSLLTDSAGWDDAKIKELLDAKVAAAKAKADAEKAAQEQVSQETEHVEADQAVPA